MSTHKYITGIRLYHFQGHIDRIIKLGKGLNAFVGPSDSGKSSITRALYWALYNKPTRVGDEYTTYGANHCFVTVMFNDGTEITRGRNKDENYYVLRVGDEVKEFKGFGFEVPPEITTAHGMPLIDFDDSGQHISLNITMQLDSIFMFEDSATRRAKVLGKLCGADRVDGALGVAAGWLSERRADKAKLSKDKRRLEGRMKDYRMLDTMRQTIENASKLIERGRITEKLKDSIVGDLANLHLLMADKLELELSLRKEQGLNDFDVCHATLINLQELRSVVAAAMTAYCNSVNDKNEALVILGKADGLVGLDTLIVQAENSTTMRDVIAQAYNDYRDLRNRLDEMQHYLEHAADIDELDNKIQVLNSGIQELIKLQHDYTDYLEYVSRYTQGNQVLSNLEESMDVINKQIDDVVYENGGVCPVCGEIKILEVRE